MVVVFFMNVNGENTENEKKKTITFTFTKSTIVYHILLKH